MSTVINNPGERSAGTDDSGATLMVVVVLLLVAGVLFFLFGVPALRTTNTAPTNDGAGMQIPNKIDVNVTTPKADTQPAAQPATQPSTQP